MENNNNSNSEVSNVIDEYNEKYKRLNELKRELKNKKFKRIFTFSTTLVLTGAMMFGGYYILKNKNDDIKYKHVITQYHSTKNALASLPERGFYSEDEFCETPTLVVKTPWEKSKTNDNFVRYVYRYRLNGVNEQALIDYVEAGNYDNIKEVFTFLPEPTLGVESSENAIINDTYDIVLTIDRIVGEPLIIENKRGDLIFGISMALGWLVALFGTRYPQYLKEELDLLNDSYLEEINSLENDICKLKLKK